MHLRSVRVALLLLVHFLLLGWSGLGETASSILNGLILLILLFSQLGRVSDVPVAAGLTSDTHDSRVDGARDAVLLLDIDFWEHEELLLVCRSLLDILLGRRVDNSLHLEPLDRLVLWHTSSAVDAHDDVRVSLVFFTPTVVSSL